MPISPISYAIDRRSSSLKLLRPGPRKDSVFGMKQIAEKCGLPLIPDKVEKANYLALIHHFLTL